MKQRARLIFALGMLCSVSAMADGLITGSWEKELRPRSVGTFPLIENCEAQFVFGWSNVQAGKAWFRFQRRGAREYRAEFRGETTGWVRTLWQADITYETGGRIPDLQTHWMKQIEKYGSYRIEIEAEFTPERVRRIRQRIPSTDKNSWRTFHLPGLRDILGAMLFVRSQPLRPGDRIVTLCYPGDAPYLVRVHVKDVENISWQEEKVDALRLEIQLQRIETRSAERGQLKRHRKFRSGSVWLTNDERRLPLRAEVSIFIGFIYAELISWQNKE